MAHTPGPWSVQWHTQYPDNGGETQRLEISGDGTEICLVPIEDSQDTDEHRQQRKANARLIKAAPKLLAACEAVLEFLEDGTLWEELSPAEQSVILAMQDAIESATA